MGHARASDLMQSLIEVLKDLDYVNKMVQISKYCPSVNRAPLDNLSIHRKEENTNAPDLDNSGSCGLHIVHGSFSTASEKTHWSLEASLKSFYKNFKDSPARRADCLEFNGLNEMHDRSFYLFPMKYCGHRWLENIPVIDRIIKILPKLKVYSNKIKKDPCTKTFKSFKAAVNDVMLPIILEFYRAVSTTMEPFLRCFQSEKPVAVFLYEKVSEIMISLMERFVRSEVLLANSCPIKLLRINLDDKEVLLPASSINVSFGPKVFIKKISTVNQIKVRNYYYDVKLLLKTIVEKLRERSRLKYKLTRAISSLSPTQISTLSEAIIRKQFNILMELMVESN